MRLFGTNIPHSHTPGGGGVTAGGGGDGVGGVCVKLEITSFYVETLQFMPSSGAKLLPRDSLFSQSRTPAR